MPDPLRQRGDWLRAAAFFAVVTVAYLWFALLPTTFGSMLQTRDSVRMAVIMEHVYRALFHGDVSFWDLRMFAPYDDLLCLSEPMVTQAILTAPLTALFGYPTALNAWIYVSWFSMGLMTWAYLRHRGVDNLSSIWAGFFVAFCPDRAWHAAGHGHLYFQTGFIVSLLAVERAFRPNASRWWGTLFGGAFLMQVMSGFYVTVLFGAWGLLMLPAGAWWAAGGSRTSFWSAFKRQAPQMIAWVALTLALFAPLVMHYSAFGKTQPQLPLEQVQRHAANWKGYLLPPAEPERILTPTGWAYIKLHDSAIRNENTQYLGLAVVGLLLAGAVLVFRRWREGASWRSTNAVFLAALILTGFGALVLSLGPFLTPDLSRLTRLPFAYIYAEFPSFRFFRAPARFAFVVTWCLALLGALALTEWRARLEAKGFRRASMALAVGVLVLTMVEFLPLTRIYQIDATRTPFAEYLANLESPKAFVEFPTNTNRFMVGLGWNHVPVANGFSSYPPPNRLQELEYLDAHFPSKESLLVMGLWGIDRAMVSRWAPEEFRIRCAQSESLEPIWEGSEGTLYRLTQPVPNFNEWLTEKRRDAGWQPEETAPPIPLMRGNQADEAALGIGYVFTRNNTRQLPDGDRETLSTYTPMEFDLETYPITPPVYTRLVLRVRMKNWYSLRENGYLYWGTANRPELGEDRVVRFIIPADGEWHDIPIELGESIAWLTDEPITRIRLDLGGRIQTRVNVDYLAFEESQPRWSLDRMGENSLSP